VSIEAAALKQAPTGEPGIEYLFCVLDDKHQGERRRSLQTITPETYAGTIRNLRVHSVKCEPRDIAGYLTQVCGVELDIEITNAPAVIFTRRLDDRCAVERGVTKAAEPLPDVAALFGWACGDSPGLEFYSVEEWECGDSHLCCPACLRYC
jgi:hypothetical protein